MVGKIIDLEINDLFLKTSSDKTNLYSDLEIIGVTLDNYSYVSKNILKEYMLDNKSALLVNVEEDDVKEFERIFKEFPTNNSKYVAKTIYSDTVKDVENTVEKISVIAKYFSIGVLIFSVILFNYFIVSSINSNKKSIGILRALGAKVSDIYKIFYLESFGIGIISFIGSMLVTYFSSFIANDLISKNLFMDMNPIVFRIDLVWQLFIIIILLTIVAFIMPIINITRTKPIDVIYEKD